MGITRPAKEKLVKMKPNKWPNWYDNDHLKSFIIYDNQIFDEKNKQAKGNLLETNTNKTTSLIRLDKKRYK